MTGDCHVRICGSRGLRCPRPPDQPPRDVRAGLVYVLQLHVPAPEGIQQPPTGDLHGLPAGGLSGQADVDEPPGRVLADSSACEPDPRRPRSADQSAAAGLARILHRVLPERGGPTLPAHRPPSGALGAVEVQAAGAKRQAGTGVAARGPIPGARAVRALALLQRSGLIAGRHEPYEPRGSRADLWGPGGEIPPGYPARARGRPPGGGDAPSWMVRGVADQRLAGREGNAEVVIP
jgi:hypothetical protein